MFPRSPPRSPHSPGSSAAARADRRRAVVTSPPGRGGVEEAAWGPRAGRAGGSVRAGGAERAGCAGRLAPACWAGCGPGPGGAGLHRSLRAGASAGSDCGNDVRGTAGRDGGREGSLPARARRGHGARGPCSRHFPWGRWRARAGRRN